MFPAIWVLTDTTDIPADLQDKAEQYRAELLDKVAESDEELLEKYLESGELTEDEIRSGIRKLTINREAYPVLCGSAFKDKGVQPMLDAVVDYLPSPEDVPSIVGFDPKDESIEIDRKPTTDDPFSAWSSRSLPTRSTASSCSCASTPAPSPRATPCLTPPRARRNASARSSRCTPTRGEPGRCRRSRQHLHLRGPEEHHHR